MQVIKKVTGKIGQPESQGSWKGRAAGKEGRAVGRVEPCQPNLKWALIRAANNEAVRPQARWVDRLDVFSEMEAG